MIKSNSSQGKRYSSARLLVLFLLVIVCFALNYFYVYFIDQQQEIKEKISELIIYNFTLKPLNQDPFVGESLRQGMVGGIAIDYNPQFSCNSTEKEQVKQLLQNIQGLSVSSSKPPVLLTYNSDLLKVCSLDRLDKNKLVETLRQLQFNFFLLPANIDIKDSPPTFFRLADTSTLPDGTRVSNFYNSQQIKLTSITNSKHLQEDIVKAFQNKADLIYIRQNSNERPFRIFRIVNMVLDALHKNQITESQIESSYQKIRKLRTLLQK